MNKDLIIEMYKQGQGISTIAFKLKLKVDGVLKVVTEAGIKRDRKASLKIANNLRLGEKRKPYKVT